MEYSEGEIKKHVAAAQKSYQKAVDLTKTSVLAFRFAPDYEGSVRIAKNSITVLRRCGIHALDLLAKFLLLSADNNERLDLLNFAGNDYDECANVCLKRLSAATSGALPLSDALKNEVETLALRCFTLAAEAYIRNKQIDHGATVSLKGAKAAKSMERPEECAKFYESVFELYELEQKPSTSETACKEAIGYYVDIANYTKALELLERQNKLFRMRIDMFEQDIYKNYLCMTILLLATKQYSEAVESLNRWENDVSLHFGNQRESVAANALIGAMAKSDEAVAEVQKSHSILRSINNSVARVAKKLKADPTAVSIVVSSFTLEFFEGTAGETKPDAGTDSDMFL